MDVGSTRATPLRSILLLAVLMSASCAQDGPAAPRPRGGWHDRFRVTDTIPVETWMTPDWYSIRRGDTWRLRTNHSLAELKLRFRGSTRIGVRFEDDHLTAPGISMGLCAWRLTGGGRPGRWVFEHPMKQPVFATGLDPQKTYGLEVEICLPLDPAVTPLTINQLERWRDGVGRQGNFTEMSGFVFDEGTRFLPWPAPPHPWLTYIVYGDSLADGGVLEPSGGPEDVESSTLNRKGASACWPRKAIRIACKRLKRKRTPRGINHSFGGWWGCRIHYPIMGYASEAELRRREPWFPPDFRDVVKRSHPGAPEFALDHVDLVVYALAQNDLGTGRLLHPADYAADLVENIQLLEKTWPGAKILVTATHVSDKPLGLMQQAFMQKTLESKPLDYRHDPDLHFVNPTVILHRQGVFPQKSHPPEKIHDIWAIWIGEEIRRLLEGRAVEPDEPKRQEKKG